MYIVVIAWLYVVTLMAFTEKSVVAGVLTFLFFGLGPCALVVWLFGGPIRAKRKRYQQQQLQRQLDNEAESLVPDEDMHQHDRADTQADQKKLGE